MTSDVWYDLCDDGDIDEYYKRIHGHSIKSPEAAKARIRDTIQVKYVKAICDDLGIRRADIKILAGDVGYLYFRGERYAISLDHLDSLKGFGSDLLIIEKQGVAEVLKDLAAPYGIALLSTRGFLTENALDLAELAESSGGNVAILTDDDISGHVIAHKVPTVPRIGIDMDTLDDLDIDEDKIEELKQGEFYTPSEEHLAYAEKHMDLDEDTLEFLRDRRIEINAVKNAAGPEELWNWILRRLQETYPNRDMTRAVNTPDPSDFRPPELDQLSNIVYNKIGNTLRPEIKRVKEELYDYEGFIEDVDEYEQDLNYQFEAILNGGNGKDSISSDVDTSLKEQTQRATKNFLKNIRRDLAKLVQKYGSG